MPVNEQAIEKMERSPDGTLDVHSLFYTIQGEGPECGKPAIFLRLAGCNLQCPGCDTNYTSPRKRHSVAIIIAKIGELRDEEYPNAPKPLIVVTGGEPFRQNIGPLARSLVRNGYRVQVETNGTLSIPEDFPAEALVVCSPKTGKIHKTVEERAVALKYVVKAGAVGKDGLPTRALDHSCTPNVAKPPLDFAGKVYVQPMDEGNAAANRRNTQIAISSCLHNGHTLQIQIHKVVGVE